MMFQRLYFKSILAVFAMISLTACKEYLVSFSEKYRYSSSRPIEISISAKEKNSQQYILDFQASDFALLEDGQPVSGTESAAGTQLIKGNVTLNTAFLIDLSGSVSTDKESFQKLKQAVTNFAQDYFNSSDNTSLRLGVFSFDGREGYRSLVPGYSFFGKNQLPQLLATVDKLSCPSVYCEDSSTNLNESLFSLIGRLQGLSDNIGDSSLQKNITNVIVYTDGTDQASRMSSEEVESAVQKSRLNHYGVTVGLEVNQEQIKKLSPSGAFHASDMGGLQAIFKKLVAHLKEQASANMTIQYCSPKRRGQHKLTVQVKYQGAMLASKDFEFKADDNSGLCQVSRNNISDNQIVPSLDENLRPISFKVSPLREQTPSRQEPAFATPPSSLDQDQKSSSDDDEEDPEDEEGFKP